MSYFLWIEDFENSPEVTADEVLGGIGLTDNEYAKDKNQLKRQLKSQGIFVELSLQDGLVFIQKHLADVDYVILDIDLVPYCEDDEINNSLRHLLEQFHDYQPEKDLKIECGKLKATAGYYLYTELLVEKGFPKHHILFCSNHGDTTLEAQKAFKSAKIELPPIYTKSDSAVKTWVKECYENPYSRLRRGIIQACQFLKDKKLRFDNYSTDTDKPIALDIENYLAILSEFLPLFEPEEKQSKYKLFVRTLAHEWDDAVKPKKLGQSNFEKQASFAFSWIMKITRNWSAHSNVFDQLSAQDVAFLFIVNMRAMFNLGSELTPYERYLLSLFDLPLTEKEFESQCGKDYKNRKIPLTKTYASLLNKYGTNYEAINFHDLLNEIQKKKNEKNEFLVKGLYQVFWFLTSFGRVYIDPHHIHDQKYLNYKFAYFNYFSEGYLSEIGRHIYSRSFPED